MKIGFIGAGKVGSAFGRYLKDHEINVAFYSSRTERSACEAAMFADAEYIGMELLVEKCDYIFITTPDDQIIDVWNQIKKRNLQDKKIFHMSGSLSADVFDDIENHGACGYSLHPLFPFTDKLSYKQLEQAVFTIEGKDLASIQAFLEKSKITFFEISGENKAKYHAAAVFASNYVVALARISKALLIECDIPKDAADQAICSLIEGTCGNIKKSGVEASLTGPIIRGDIGTLKRHLDAVGKYKEIYAELGMVALGIAEERGMMIGEEKEQIFKILGGGSNEKNSNDI